MTFQFQSKTVTDSASGRKYVMVVKMEARQSGNNIQMRAIAPAYKVWSDSSTPLDRGFDVDTLWIGIDKEAYPLRISGSSVTGCGINTLSMKHVGVNAVCRFENKQTSRVILKVNDYKGTLLFFKDLGILPAGMNEISLSELTKVLKNNNIYFVNILRVHG